MKFEHNKKFLTEPLTKVPDALKLFAWSHPFESTLCLGWIVTSPMAGMLPWRSHVAITAEAGTGKTTLVNRIADLLKQWGPIKMEGATEAGLRQTIRNNAVPVLIDEMDTNSLDEKSFQNILKYFRVASTGGVITKGSPGGRPNTFRANFSGLIAGINLPKFAQADETRFTVLELNHRNKRGLWTDMNEVLVESLNHKSSVQILNWTLRNPHFILEQIDKATHEVEKISDSRTAQQFGVLLGGAASFLDVEPETLIPQLKEYWLFKNGSFTEIHSDKDYDRCVEHLFGLLVGRDEANIPFSLGDLIHGPGAIDTKNKYLAQFGMKLHSNGEFFIPYSNAELKKHFKETPWPSWVPSLRRIEKSHVTAQRIGGVVKKGVKIQLDIPAEIM